METGPDFLLLRNLDKIICFLSLEHSRAVILFNS